MESSRLKVVVGNNCSVGYVVRIMVREIVYIIIVVVDPRSTVLRRCI